MPREHDPCNLRIQSDLKNGVRNSVDYEIAHPIVACGVGNPGIRLSASPFHGDETDDGV